MNRIKTLIIFFCLAAAATVNAKSINAVEEDSVKVAAVITAYADSLSAYRAQLDSVLHLNDSITQLQGTNVKYYRLFAPLAYYPGVTGNLISGNESIADDDYDEAVENVLYQMYMKRPELVRTTVNKLHKSASKASKKATIPVSRKVDVAKKQEEVVEEIPVGNPVEIFVAKPNFWKFLGDYSLQFMQSHLSENWYQSGESNLSMIGAVTLQANYNNKQKVKWENKLEMKLGFQTSESDTVHQFKTSSDLLRYTGKLGIQATKNWYYTLQVLATTQFAYGLKANDKKIYSDFFSPVTVNISPGMDYNFELFNKKLTGSVHIAPFAYNWKHVSRQNLAERNGIDKEHHSKEDYGSQVTSNITWKPTADISWQSRIYAYTTYERMEFECENTINYALSKYITTTLFLYPRFDDGVKRDNHDFWQFKEYFSLGFKYSM